MKIPQFALVLAFAGLAGYVCLGEASLPLVRRTVFAHDDYEDAAAKREGSPQIVKGILSPGMLEQTGQGRYVTSGVKQIRCTNVGLVSGDGLFAMQTLRLYALDEGVRIESAFVVGKLPGDHVFSAAAERTGETVKVTVTDDGRVVGTCSTLVSKLPSDFEAAVSPSGEFRVSLRSLVDSSVAETSGRADFLTRYPNGFRAFWWMHAPKGTAKGASLTVDELWTGLAQENREKAVPYVIDRLETFDPEKAGWKLVFEDEFDGEQVAWGDKWFQTYYNVCPRELVSVDGEGHAKIKVDYVTGTTNRLVSSGLYTRKAFGYGYYAARVKFTRQNGFWSAFWTYGDANSNPFLDGFEIDGYEDYYLREKDATGKVVGDMLDHNLHVRGGLGRSKSWNYKTHLEGIDEWHVLGVRWTPFEISYYLDGKLMKSGVQVGHSPYDTVTFDAFHHAACTAPNHAVLSGCIMHAAWNKRFHDLTGCTFPDYFTVDWVRVWEFPDPPETRPAVAWTAETAEANVFAPTGSVVKLSVDVMPAAKSGAKIKGVYLFDSGFFLQCRTEPPFAFEIPLTEAFYSRTAYARPGRQRDVFTLAKDVPHVFHVFVQDENGRVGRTELPLFRIPKRGESAPYEGVAQKLPGVLNVARFDAGGVGVGYYKHPMTVEKIRKDLNPRPSYAFRGDEHVSCSESGDAIDFMMSSEWLNYTVDVAAAGTYAVAFAYGAPGQGWNELQLYMDGRLAGRVALAPRTDALDVSFARDAVARAELPLTAGRHVLTILPVGPVSIGSLTLGRCGDGAQR